jgi:hypothetical protein
VAEFCLLLAPSQSQSALTTDQGRSSKTYLHLLLMISRAGDKSLGCSCCSLLTPSLLPRYSCTRFNSCALPRASQPVA